MKRKPPLVKQPRNIYGSPNNKLIDKLIALGFSIALVGTLYLIFAIKDLKLCH